MKIVVSYLSSLYDTRKTIELIDKTTADGIHADLMDGLYVPNKNFDIYELDSFYKDINKPIEFHLMVNNPSRYINILFKYNPTCVYIHPKTEKDPITLLKLLNSNNVIPGIAINPNEELFSYEELFPYIKRVLLMSVYPGMGGQTFLNETIIRLEKLKKYQEKYNFEIYVDGGINANTIKKVIGADGIISGSYICKSKNYQDKINELIECQKK